MEKGIVHATLSNGVKYNVFFKNKKEKHAIMKVFDRATIYFSGGIHEYKDIKDFIPKEEDKNDA